MIVSTSEPRANAILNKVAIYGLPASLADNLLGGLLLIGEQGEYDGVSLWVGLFYAGFSAIGAMCLFWLVRLQASHWRLD